MQDNRTNEIYSEIIRYCKVEGLIDKLSASMAVSETRRFDSLNIEQEGLDVLDAVHCLVDERRTILLLEEIQRVIKHSDVVIEAGVGTGILSFVASRYARKVLGFEINPNVYSLANKIKKHLFGLGMIDKNIDFFLADAREVKDLDGVDVLISENLYTGMFFEKQVQITRSMSSFLKTNGVYIPSGIASSFSLASTAHSTVGGIEMEVLSELDQTPVLLSKTHVYDKVEFGPNSKNVIEYFGTVGITLSGEINSIVICSDILLTDNRIINRYDTTFMNNDILLLLPDTTKVESGDVVEVSISYQYGSNPKDAVIVVKKV